MQSDGGIPNLNQDKHQYLIINQLHEDNNSIDLTRIFSDLYKKRWFIAITTVLCALLTTVIALILKPEYQTKTLLTEPNASQYQALYLNTDSKLTSSQLFQQFLKTISAKSNYINFLQQTGLQEQLIPKFKKLSDFDKLRQLNKLTDNYKVFIINHSKKDDKDAFKDNSLEAELLTYSKQLDLDAQFTNAYLDYTNKTILADIVQGERSITQRKIAQLTESISLDKLRATAERKNAIKRLINNQSISIANLNNKIEALKRHEISDKKLRLQELINQAPRIAKSLSIARHDTVVDHSATANLTNNITHLPGTNIRDRGIDLVYMEKQRLNYQKALSKLQQQLYLSQNNQEIAALKNRTDDSPYITNIRTKNAELKHLKSLSFDIAKISTYKVNGSHIIDKSSRTPNNIIIVILGMILGFIGSILYVIVQNNLSKHRLVAA